MMFRSDENIEFEEKSPIFDLLTKIGHEYLNKDKI